MKICIPVSGPEGLDAKLHPEFTETEHLLVFDVESGEHKTVSHGDPEGSAEEPIAVDVVLCAGMPAQLLQAFADQGIHVFATEAETAGLALMALQNGDAEELVLEGCGGGCGCGGHSDEEDHECCGGENHSEGGCGGGCGCH